MISVVACNNSCWISEHGYDLLGWKANRKSALSIRELALTTWFWAAYLTATHSNGISALQLQRQLGLGSYRSAWLLCGKLRRSMVASGRAPLAGLVESTKPKSLAAAKTIRLPAVAGIATKVRC